MHFQTKICLIILPLMAFSIFFMGFWSLRTAQQPIEGAIHRLMIQELEHFVKFNIQTHYKVLQKNRLENVGSFVTNYQQKIFNSLDDFHLIKTGSLIILDTKGKVLAGTVDDKTLPNAYLSTSKIMPSMIKSAATDRTTIMEPETGERIFATQTFAPWNWHLVYSVSRELILIPRQKVRNTAILISIACIATGSFFIILCFRIFFGRPMDKLKQAAEDIADLKDVRKIDIHSADELGNLARSMERMAAAIKEYRKKQHNWHFYLESEIQRNTKNLHRLNASLEKEIKIKKISEADLRQSEKRISEALNFNREIISASSLGITVYDGKGKCVLANDAACKIISGTQEQLLSQNFYKLKSWKTSGLAHMADKVLTDGRQRSMEARTISTFGKDFWIECRFSRFTMEGQPHLLIIFDNIYMRKQMERQIKASLKEKNILLKEIHHRVKNNLQVVSSLLKMQSRLITDEHIIRIFQESQNRIAAMALVHEQLYKSDNLAVIDFSTYIFDLVHSLQYSFGTDSNLIRLTVDIRHKSMGVDTAVPCGLIVNELISNAFKYSVKPGEKGEISMLFQLHDKQTAQMIIADTGPGIPKDFDIDANQSLGLKLVNNIVTHQLEGSIQFICDKGTRIEILFPYSNEKELKRLTAGETETPL
ncbi:histidine kinase dimerization/phosphoacceptor domain -containing protein [Desulfobacula phenolica]|nr:histidine kinase dimerization/phosphoacceptor domain -containing protein [Desulfobacula phenolica]